ncbi:unnamed protein product [Adineta ricciae]|uniref:MAM domain-containing protein n=1 Tax=Adineta ricciae TaxID=249248 RepID=A0A816BN46_ADIRI|nr:unnamed protein product [Adineta ricciae]
MYSITIMALVVAFIMKTHANRTTIFSCDFNSGLTLECSFLPTVTGSNLQFSSGSPVDSTEPQRPASDATSIITPINGSICNLPYQINGWDMHFCLKQDDADVYTCPTDVSNASRCTTGKYGYATVNQTKTFDQTYSTIVRNNTAVEQCLTFYYYFTNHLFNPTIEVFWQSLTPYSEDHISIIKVASQRENKWYKSSTSFVTNSSNFFLKFQFHRDSGSNANDFTFAVDDISITSDLCNTAQPSLQNFTIDVTDESTNYISSSESYSTNIPMDLDESTLLAQSSSSILVNISAEDIGTSSDFELIFNLSSTRASTVVNQPYSTEAVSTSKVPSSSTTIKREETFSSTIQLLTNTSTATTSIQTTTQSSSAFMTRSNVNTALIIGLSVGLALPMTVLSTIGLVYYFKYYRSMSYRTRRRIHTNRTITFNDD